MKNRLRTILFDLDGTFADTAPDITHSINLLRQECGLEPLTEEHLRPWVSHGTSAIVEQSFGKTEKFPQLRQRFLDIYRENTCVYSQPFSGIAALLDYISKRNMKWGIVTNKPSFLTDPLMQQLGYSESAACIISGDTCEFRKPHPGQMLLAAQLCECQPEECLYLGDHPRDIQAGNDANMLTIVAAFGYLSEEDDPHTWGADHIIQHPLELREWMEQYE